MKVLNRFWVYDFDEEEEIFARTSWMIPGFDRNRGKAPVRKRAPRTRRRKA